MVTCVYIVSYTYLSLPFVYLPRPEEFTTQISYGDDQLRDSQRSTVSISSQTSKVSKSSQTSKSSQRSKSTKVSFSNNLKSIRHSFRRAKEKGQVEGIKLFSTPV